VVYGSNVPAEILVEAIEDVTVASGSEVDVLQLVIDHFGVDLDKIGFYYEDLSTGEVVQIQAEQQFRTASVSKMIVLMALMDAVTLGTADLEDVVVYSPNDFEWGSGVIAYEDLSQPNLAFEVGTLAEYAVVYSDNIAFNMLWRYMGTEEVYTFFEEVIGHETNRGVLYMSAEDAAKLMGLLYESEGEHYDTLRENLKNTVFPILLEEYLPEGAVAHKVGFYLSYLHDAGIVFTDNGDYVLSVFSMDLPNGYESIAELSLKIYEARMGL
jgi:beta-lactamase class A